MPELVWRRSPRASSASPTAWCTRPARTATLGLPFSLTCQFRADIAKAPSNADKRVMQRSVWVGSWQPVDTPEDPASVEVGTVRPSDLDSISRIVDAPYQPGMDVCFEPDDEPADTPEEPA